METKQCNECLEIKIVSEFYRRNNRPCGYQSRCRKCSDQAHAEYIKTKKGRESIRHTGKKIRPYRRAWDRSEKGKEKRRRYAQTEKGRKLHREAQTMYRKQNQEKIKAQSAVYTEVCAGRIPRASTLVCIECSNQANHYHHHNGYDEKHWLDVVPLCIDCHNKLNRLYD